MIRRFFCALLALAMLCSGAYANDMNGLVRLHIIAADDSPEAQGLKLELRDICLRCAEVCLGDAPDADTAYMRLQAHIHDFEAACIARARELGYAGSITAETGIFEFPDRLYGDLLVPKGDYRALRITIGDGEGHNWWCILYPTLCVLDESQFASGDAQPSGIIRWLRARFGGGQL